jgi:hydroxylamine reductase
MFCYQCEQTDNGTGCVVLGKCGKTPEVAALQDLLLYLAETIAATATVPSNSDTAVFLERALFTTVTNVSFDAQQVESMIREGNALLAAAGASTLASPTATRQDLLTLAERASIKTRIQALGPDRAGFQDLLTAGLKGMAAYGHHARVLGRMSPAVDAFMREGLAFLTDPAPTADALFGKVMRCGEACLGVLELLDRANTGEFGQPVPTTVSIGHRKGKAILVSGHDLKDLGRLLEMTRGRGIDVYTHGEMLPAHGYPGLKQHPHLVGHFGGAWQNQRRDFAAFPGPILMTTNCLMPPVNTYRDRVFTTGLVGFPGVIHVANGAFEPVVEAALAAPGFADVQQGVQHTVGFAHDAVLGLTDVLVDALRSGALQRLVLIGGCDGTEGARSYYSDLAAALPIEWAVLTLGCGKFRVLGHVAGNIGPLPRVLDMGQCNDAYSAIKVAGVLSARLGLGLNELPLNFVFSWFEQKAITVLLALLYLGVKNIRIGPRLPAFVTPGVLQVLVENFNILPITDVMTDLRAMAA